MKPAKAARIGVVLCVVGVAGLLALRILLLTPLGPRLVGARAYYRIPAVGFRTPGGFRVGPRGGPGL